MKFVTLKTYRIKEKNGAWVSAHVRRFNRYWNKELLKFPCQVCKYKEHIELCHIRSISDFPEQTRLKTINSPKNNLVLCPNHHWEFDNKILKLKDIPPRKVGTPERT